MDDEMWVQVEHAPGPDSTLCDPPETMPSTGPVGFTATATPPASPQSEVR